MIFETHSLSPTLAPYIETVFHYKNFMPDHSIERVVPTGHVFLLFELDGFERHTFDNDSLSPNATFSKAWISGIHRNCLSISAHQDSEMAVVQFKPYGSYPFTHTPSHALSEQVLPAEDAVDDSLLALRDDLVAADTSAEKFTLLETWLLDRVDHSKAPPASLVEFIHDLQSKPAAKLQQLIETYSSSQKNLIEQFKKYVGVTPKYYQRILRFNDLLLKIHQKEKIAWAEIAYECGYSDQSHFIREFQHFSGFNPSKFIREELDQGSTNFFPVDREG